jgi:hypothetical protein
MHFSANLWLASLLAAFFSASAFAAEPSNPLLVLSKQRRVLEAAVKKGDLVAARAAVEAIGDLDTQKGVQYLLSLAHIRPAELYVEVVRAIPGSRSDAMKEMLASLYRAESKKTGSGWEQRVMLLDAMATIPDEDVVTAFAMAVDDPHPKVRLAAIRRLQDIGVPTVSKVPVWIGSLGAAEKALDVGTPHIEARKNLFKGTAQDFVDAQSWQKYWKDQGRNFQPPDVPPDGSIRLESGAKYYGEAVTSRRVLFVVDTSGSMNILEQEGWPDVPQVPTGGTGNTGTDGGGSPITHPLWRQWIALNPLSVRMARAKAELAKLIDQLPPNTLFNIVAFNSQIVPWQKTLTPVGPQSVESAKRFVDLLSHGGATAADLALASAFQDNNLADTIYFLSDGEPSRDGINILPVPPLLQQVEEANRFHRIIIHTFGFGAEGEPFMKALAGQNAGTYRRIVGPPAW